MRLNLRRNEKAEDKQEACHPQILSHRKPEDTGGWWVRTLGFWKDVRWVYLRLGIFYQGKKKPLFLQWLNRNMAWQKPPDCRVIWQLKSVSRKKKSDWQKETPCQQEQHINKLPGSAQALPLTRICVIQLTPSAWAQSYSVPSLQIPRSFVFTVPSLKSLLDSLSVTSSPLPSENIAKFWETRFLYLKYNCFRHRRATAKECSSQARGLS